MCCVRCSSLKNRTVNNRDKENNVGRFKDLPPVRATGLDSMVEAATVHPEYRLSPGRWFPTKGPTPDRGKNLPRTKLPPSEVYLSQLADW